MLIVHFFYLVIIFFVSKKFSFIPIYLNLWIKNKELSIWFSPKSMLLSIRFSPILKYLVIYTLHKIHSDACLHSLLPQLNNIDPENIQIPQTVSRKIACIVVRILAGDITNLHYNFVVPKPLVSINSQNRKG